MAEELTNLDKAFELLGTVPLPDDAEDQLENLIDTANNDEKPLIETLSEALFSQREIDGTA